ncbi:hypothetical protein EIKCOROL_02151 [Eikenella corrodens ATCC 23834]|uniref:Uncharacterized protein n=1 Tax=Eikenella corrodens ATCC 23834 TaxID=546274 RepID=C0DXP0_EIKCO|nr:hypothetical protein EIKCOROL_02151 [Eikenella corrodens ATCC 23834]
MSHCKLGLGSLPIFSWQRRFCNHQRLPETWQEQILYLPAAMPKAT